MFPSAPEIQHWNAVEERAKSDDGAAEEEVRPGLEILQQEPGTQGGDDDGDGGRESFKNVVCVLDGCSDNEAAHRLQEDDGHHWGGVALQQAGLQDVGVVVVEHPGQGEQQGEQPELQVSAKYILTLSLLHTF